MKTLLAFSVLLLMLGIGDVVATKTKALLSSMFIFALLLTVAYWIGLPTDIIPTAGVITLGPIVCGLHLVNLGTTISIQQFLGQWKTIILGFVAVAAIGIVGIFILPLFIDKACALAATPVLAGGVAAMLMVSEPLQAAGLVDPEIFALLVCVLQVLVGMPIVSVIVRKDAKKRAASGDVKKSLDIHGKKSEEKEKKKLFPQLPASYQKPTVLLFKAGIVATACYWISDLTGGTLNNLLLCMIAGIILTALGFLESNILDRANSTGIVSAFIIIFIFMNAHKATPATILRLIVPLIIMFGVGIITLAVVALIMSKLLKESFNICFAIGLTCMFGYPATLFISNEVCSAVAGDDKELYDALDAYYRPKLIVGGFATMTVGSVVLATFIVPILTAAL